MSEHVLATDLDIGLGLTWVSSLMRVPSPPARITAFMGTSGRRRPARLRLVPPPYLLDRPEGHSAALRHARARA